MGLMNTDEFWELVRESITPESMISSVMEALKIKTFEIFILARDKDGKEHPEFLGMSYSHTVAREMKTRIEKDHMREYREEEYFGNNIEILEIDADKTITMLKGMGILREV